MPEANDKKQSGFGKLSKREKIMVYALILIVIVFVAMYFFIAPAITEVSDLQTEIDGLNVQRAQTQQTISLRESYQKQYDEEKLRFDAATAKYGKPLTPEALDETVTGLLIKAGFDPLSISMSPLGAELVPPFADGSLQGDVPGSAATGADDEQGAEQGDGQSAEPAPAAASFVYNVQASAEGSAAELYSLIRDLAGKDNISLESYGLAAQAEGASIIPGDDNTGAGAKIPLTGKQTINMAFKLYVYIDGVLPGAGM